MGFLNVFKKSTKYAGAVLDDKVEGVVGDELKIKMAVDDRKRQHAELEAQAAQVIGTHKKLEMEIAKKAADVEKLNVQVRQALALADQRKDAGDLAGYDELVATADQLANELVNAETALEAHRSMEQSAKVAADQAKAAVDESKVRTQEAIQQGAAMIQRIHQLELQEQAQEARAALEGNMLTPDDGSEFAAIASKIENRLATANAGVELAQGGTGAKMQEVRQLSLESAGRSRLDEIRAQMRGEQAPAIEVSAETQAKLDQLNGSSSS